MWNDVLKVVFSLGPQYVVEIALTVLFFLFLGSNTLYRRDVSPVYILAILHGSRDIATLMRDRLP